MRTVHTLVSTLVLAVVLVVAIPVPAHAVSPTINYQGKLTTSANVAVPNGQYNMRFWLLTSPSIATTSAVWTESLTGSNRVQVTNGLFSVMLGSTTPLTSVDFSQTLYLGVEIGGTSTPAWDGEMSPRKLLGTVPAAFEAENAQTLDGIATSSFLRSDQDDTASGLLTFTGGFISSASSTITNLTTGIATTTTLVINNQAFTNLLGTGLTNQSGVLTVSTTTLGFGALAALNSIDISSHTNLGVTATGLTLSGDNIALSGGYTIPLTASTTEWSNKGNVSGPASATDNAIARFDLTTGKLIQDSLATISDTGIVTASSFIPSSATVPTNGMYLPAANTLGWGINSAAELRLSATELAPAVNDGLALGSTTLGFSDIFLASQAVMNWNNGNVTLTHEADKLSFEGASSGYIFSDGNVGIGSSTPSHLLTIAGDTNITGALRFNGSAGTTGQVLVSNGGSAPAWTATSSLGFSSSFSNSAQLAALLSDETGTAGSVVFSGGPTFTGNTTLANASTTNLTISGNAYLGTVQSGTWNGTDIDISDYTNLGVTATGLTLSGDNIALSGGYTIPLTASTTEWATAYSWGNHGSAGYLTAAAIDTSSEIATIVTNEVGSGPLVFASSTVLTSPTIFGNTSMVNASTTALTVSTSAWLPSALTLGSKTFTRSGAHNLTLTTTGNTTVTLPTSGTLAALTSAMTGTFDGNNFAGGAVATGDILYGGSAGSIAELTIAASSSVLLSNGTTPVWGRVASSSLLTSTWTPGLVMMASSTAPGGLAWTATSSLGIPAGTVTSVAMTVPTGLSVTGSPITTSGTLAVSLQGGYVIPLTASTTEWASAAASTTALTPAYIQSLFTGDEGITRTNGSLSFDCSEVEGTGINCTGEDITLDATGDWTGTFDGQQGTAYLDRANHTGTQATSTITGIFADASISDTLTIGTGSTIADDLIIEPDLSADVAAADGDFLQYDSTGTNFTWRDAGEVRSDLGLVIGTNVQAWDAQLDDVADGTFATDFVNTANPWADNEVVDTLTVTGGTLGSNTISSGATWTTSGTLTIGDGGDRIDIASNTWDVTNGTITGATWNGTDIDISDYTNLGVTATGLTLSGDNIALSGGYTIPLTASTTEWHNKVSSQWTTNGSNIYYSTGAVGIGTTTPSYPLSVTGTAYVGNLIAASTTLTSTINHRLDVGVTNGSHGNPGILNVRSLGSDTSIGFENDSLGEASIIFNNSTYGLTMEGHTPGVPITIRPNGTMAGYFSDDGNVGIGTSTLQSTRLTVNGGMSLSGALLDSTRATGTVGMTLQSTGTSTRWVATSTLGFSSSFSNSAQLAALLSDETGTAGSVVFSGGPTFTGNTTLANASTTNLTISGNTYLRTILPETNLTYNIGSSAQRFNEGWISTLNLGTSTWSMTQSANGRFSLFDAASGGGTERFTVLTNGNVGVGTTSPLARLDVYGAAGSNPAFRVSSSTNATMFTVNANGNVGVGSTNPGARLEVVGDIISKGTEWTSRTSAADNHWQSVTYGNGLFVAVSSSGSSNRVMTSPDGTNWTTRTSAADRGWNSVTYGNGLFVAVANSGSTNRVMTSPDGITWTTRASTLNAWNSVTYGNGLFVAVSYDGSGNRVMTSPDGITWTTRTSAADNQWLSVTYGNGLFVAVSYDGSGNRVMTSPDGITWTIGTSATNNTWQSVTYGNGLFVAVADSGSSNRVMTSPDGITWTSRTSATSNGWRSVTYGNGLFVAVSESGSGDRVMTSPDGITWTTRTSAPDNSWRSVTYGNGLFVAVGLTGSSNRVMTSGKTEISALAHNNLFQGGMSILGGNTGIGTTSPSQLLTVSGTSSMRTILPETNLTYNIGSSAQRFNEGWISTLNLGTSTWSMTQSANGRFSLFDAASGGGTERFTVLTNGNVGIGTTTPANALHIQTAGAGEALTLQKTGTGWIGQNFIVGSKTWTLYNSSNISNQGFGVYDTTNSVYRFAIDGTDGNVGISTTSPLARLDVYGAAGSNPAFRVSSSTNTTMFTVNANGNVGIGSTNPSARLEVVGDIISKGTEWRSIVSKAVEESWTSVTYGNGRFVAVSEDTSSNRVMTSSDGINWASSTSAGTKEWTSVTYGNGLFVAVADAGSFSRVMTSPDGINWTSRTSTLNAWTSVTYGNGLFVAVSYDGSGNRVMTSPDGINWTSRTSAADNTWTSVTYGNGLFVAVSQSGSGNRVMTSPDGITWTTRTSAANNQWISVTYGNGLFVAVSRDGSSNRVMTSPDGITWTSRTSAADNQWYSVTYGNGLFVAVSYDGSGNRVMTSPDGITWTTRTSALDNRWTSVTYGNGLFVAVSRDASDDGVMISGKTEISALAHNNLFQGGMSIMSGNVGIGTTSPQRALHVQISSDAPPVRFQDSNGYCEINPTTTTWSCTSDRRLKENIKSLDPASILANLSELRPVSFAWKTDANHEDRIGLIAQEVEEFFPDLVLTDSASGMKSVAYGGFTPYLIAGVQELAQTNKNLATLLMTGTSTFATSSPFAALLETEDSLWSRLMTLAESFMDGVLTLAGIRTDELCVGSVCIDEATFLQMVEQSGGASSAPSDPEDEEDPPYIEDTGNATSTPEIEDETGSSTEDGTEDAGGSGEEANPESDEGGSTPEEIVPEPEPEEQVTEEESPLVPEEDTEPVGGGSAETSGETGGAGV